MKENIKESLQFILQHNAIGSPLVQHAQNLARHVTSQHYEAMTANEEYPSGSDNGLQWFRDLEASPQVTDEQIKDALREIDQLATNYDKYECGLPLWKEEEEAKCVNIIRALSAPPAAETPELPYNLRSQFEKFMVLWSEHLYGAPVDTDKKQDEDLGETYKSQFMAGAWFIWQSVAAGNAQLPEGSLPMLPAASQFVHGYSESQVIDFAGKVLAIAAAQQEAKPVAADWPQGWRFVEKKTCYQIHDGHNCIANLVGPDAEENAKTIARMLAAAPQEQTPADKDGDRYRWLSGGHTQEQLAGDFLAGRQPEVTSQDEVIAQLATHYEPKQRFDDLIDAALQSQPQQVTK